MTMLDLPVPSDVVKYAEDLDALPMRDAPGHLGIDGVYFRCPRCEHEDERLMCGYRAGLMRVSCNACGNPDQPTG